MAAPTSLRIVVVATRLGGTDGVSLEAGTWARVLRDLGHEVHAFTGRAETPQERCTVEPLAFFGHPEVRACTASVFGTRQGEDAQVQDARRRIAGLTTILQDELERFIAHARPDLLMAENVLSLPVHVPLGVAVARLAQERRLPVLAHHHDLPWERSRFSPSAVEDLLAEAFPPRGRHVHHVCINTFQRNEIARRIDRIARVIPNVIEWDEPVERRERTAALRRALGLEPEELFVLQPTRVVPRKGIEHAIELVRRLDERAALVVTGAAGDEGHAYRDHLEVLARLLRVHLVWANGLAAAEGREGIGAFSLEDAFEAADLVTYPSLLEGFGRAFLAAVRHRRPIVVNRYPVYDRDIRPLGFRTIELDGFVSEDAVAQVRRVLGDPELRAAWAAHNAVLVRRHFSTDLLRRELPMALAEAVG